MRSKLVKALLRVVTGLIRILPRAWVPVLANIFAWLAPKVLKRDRKLIAGNVQRVYDLPPHSEFSKAFQTQVFRSQALVALETFKHKFSTRPLITLEGLEAVKACLESIPGGFITVTAHQGSWELIPSCVARFSERKFFSLAKPSKLPEFTEILQSMRGSDNTAVLWTDSKNLLRDMIRVLKEQQVLGFVMDQKPENRQGPLVDFMGHPTEFVSGPAKLAIRQQCAVVAFFARRVGPWTYKMDIEVLVPADHGVSDEQALTQRMAAAIERSIRLYPEQWIWNYKRWRTPQAVQQPVLS